MKTIIIDDEPLARSLLAEMLESEKDIQIVATCNDGFEGMKAILEHKPDLVFLDIQMPKITGFELLELLDAPPNIIFTTAHDEHALKAFEVNALDYLLKPIHSERLQRALAKVRNQIGATLASAPAADKKPIQLSEQLHRIVVKDAGHIKIIPLHDVMFIEAADDYVKVTTADKYYLKHQRMAHFEEQLPSMQFVRVHRSYIVNVQHIHKVELYEKESYCVVLRDHKKVPVSRSGYAKLKGVLGI